MGHVLQSACISSQEEQGFIPSGSLAVNKCNVIYNIAEGKQFSQWEVK